MKSSVLSIIALFFISLVSANVSSEPEKLDWTPTFKQGINISHWMAQHSPGKYADPYRFSEADAKWIATHGFDHVRIPVDGRILMSVEGKLINELMEPFDQSLVWAKKYKLGVILDMHYMPGAHFLVSAEENKLWVDKDLQATVKSMWSQIAKKYIDVGEFLRYEVLNEAVAPTSEKVNNLNKMIVAAVREIDPTRVIYVSSNMWGNFELAEEVYVFKDDPNVHYAFHTYEPLIFTHQHASWNPHTQYYSKDLNFPFKVTDLDKYLPEDSGELVYNNKLIDEKFIDKKFDKLGDWAKRNNVQVLVTEFGVINGADDPSTERFIRAIKEASERNNFGWAVWGYKGDFAVRLDGKPTAVWRGLFK